MSRNKSQLPPPPFPPTLLTVDQFLAATNLGRTHFYALRNQGLIRTVKIGSRGVRVPASEAAALPGRLQNLQSSAAKHCAA